MNTLEIVFATCLVVAFATPLSAQSSYSDDFEAPTLNAFWTPTAQSGSITLSATSVHGGSQAVRFDSVDTSQNKHMRLNHTFAAPTYGTLSVWMNDTGATATSSNYIGMWAMSNADQIGVFTFDYNSSPTNGGSYTYNLPGTPTPTQHSNVPRTSGWHLFTIAATPTSLTLSVDGTVIHNSPGNHPFTSFYLYMGGPSWRPAWTSSFDDFSFVALAPATYSLFGAGCVGTNGTPTLGTPTVGPRIGTTLQVPVSSLPIVSAAFGMLGLSNSIVGGLPLPLPLASLGMPGCQLLGSADLIVFLGNRPTPTTALWSWAIPGDAALFGVDFYQQVLVVDPGINAFGAVTSNGGHGTIGH